MDSTRTHLGALLLPYHMLMLAMSLLRVRPGILLGDCEPYNSARHKADHRKDDEGEVATREVS
jgi:hypothetical protein